MKTVPPPSLQGKRFLTYNESHEYTRRVPTYLTPKQRERDSKIVAQICRAYDDERDVEKALDIFFNKSRLLSNTTYWEVLRTVWLIGGSTDLVPKFLPYFHSTRGATSWFMTPEDSKALEEMDFPMLLYRAYKSEDDKGISWTRDKAFAEYYAQTIGGKVKSKLFDREEIYAYISRRGEEEFLIL